MQLEFIHSQPDRRFVDPPPFPFSAVAGHEQAKHALLLLAVDEGLRGVVISCARGSAKTTLARSFKSLLPGDNARPFVELPLNATEGGLLGELNLEATLATGAAQLTTGLLARAHGGILYSDDLALLDAGLINHVAAALDSRKVRIERDGASAVLPSDFVLVATCDSQPQDVAQALLDRVGLRIEARRVIDAQERAEIIELGLRFQSDPHAVAREFAAKDEETRAALSKARALLPVVSLGKTAARGLAEAAIRLGVEGNRADIFAWHAARASAALAGRREVVDDDLVTAIKFVLLPRANALPEDGLRERPDSRPEMEEAGEEAFKSKAENQSPSLHTPVDELILRAIDSSLRVDLLNKHLPESRFQSSGRRVAAINSERGRARKAVHKNRESTRVAVCATVRAAAPFQRQRRKSSPQHSTESRLLIEPSDLRFKKFKQKTGAFFIFAVDASGSMAINRMAQAKGALTRLLQETYLHRDKVALISFRGL
ncbi:MAG TPA: ATP-binding protein, partial [Blastocatellia bacterium]|nr:ATP-binding protein [Blastocatellia bacterium]